MTQNDSIDCVQMKHDLQRKLLEKWKGRSDREIVSGFQHQLDASDDALARWWRAVRSRRTLSATPE